jgi:hypothetical protein
MNIIKPEYYHKNINGTAIDVFDIAEAYSLTNREFNAVKYILRRKENKMQDIEKAIRCLQREIEFLKNKENAIPKGE